MSSCIEKSDKELFESIDIRRDWIYDPSWDESVIAHGSYWGVPVDNDKGYLIEIDGGALVLKEWDNSLETVKETRPKENFNESIEELIGIVDNLLLDDS